MKTSPSAADTVEVNVSTTTWAFKRAGQRLTIRRDETPDGALLTIFNGSTDARSFRFADRDALIAFQSDMEKLLIRTGWSFAEFSPQRRAGTERREWPRMLGDRRRWWTDGAN